MSAKLTVTTALREAKLEGMRIATEAIIKAYRESGYDMTVPAIKNITEDLIARELSAAEGEIALEIQAMDRRIYDLRKRGFQREQLRLYVSDDFRERLIRHSESTAGPLFPAPSGEGESYHGVPLEIDPDCESWRIDPALNTYKAVT